MRWLILLALLLASPALAEDNPHPGQPVDIAGRPAIDPTRNVLDKVNDVEKRLNDLRDMDHAMNELRYSATKESIALRADYEDKLRKAEASRLDAIRLVDTTNLSVDRERAAATAQALQKKGDDSALVLSAAVVKSADDVRNIVKTTADEQARNLATQLGGIQAQFTDIGKRLTLLEQTGAEGLGKQKFQDPAQVALTAAVQRLVEAQNNQAGTGTGRGEVVAWVVGGIMLFIAIIGSIVAVATFVTRSKTPPPVQPVLPVEPVYASGTKRR